MRSHAVVGQKLCPVFDSYNLEAIAIRLETIAIRLETIAIRLETIVNTLEAIICFYGRRPRQDPPSERSERSRGASPGGARFQHGLRGRLATETSLADRAWAGGERGVVGGGGGGGLAEVPQAGEVKGSHGYNCHPKLRKDSRCLAQHQTWRQIRR